MEQDSPQSMSAGWPSARPGGRRGRREDELGSLTGRVIGAAIAVHRQLGPGLLESAYEECLGFELAWNGIDYERQVPLPLE